MKKNHVIKISFKPMFIHSRGRKIYGKFIKRGKSLDITVDPSPDLNTIVEILAHELGHAILTILGPSSGINRDTQEYFADAIGCRAKAAYIEVLQRSGK